VTALEAGLVATRGTPATAFSLPRLSPDGLRIELAVDALGAEDR